MDETPQTHPTNPPMQKEATRFSDEELRMIFESDRNFATQVESTYKQLSTFFENGLQKIDRMFSDFTTRTGVLVTCASLLSALPALTLDDRYTQTFLVWTFPLLLLAIATYHPSSVRTNAIVKDAAFPPTGTIESLIVQRDWTIGLRYFYKLSVQRYDSVLRWDRITKALIYAYISSVCFNFYTFVFHGPPEVQTSVTYLMTSCAIGGITILWARLHSVSNKTIRGPEKTHL